MKAFERTSLFCAIAALITNILFFCLSGVPASIPLGIFAIAFAILSKESPEDKLSKKGRTALILAIIALVFGIAMYAMMYYAMKVMSDPVQSKQMVEMINSIKGQMPAEMQQMFEQAGF